MAHQVSLRMSKRSQNCSFVSIRGHLGSHWFSDACFGVIEINSWWTVRTNHLTAVLLASTMIYTIRLVAHFAFLVWCSTGPTEWRWRRGCGGWKSGRHCTASTFRTSDDRDRISRSISSWNLWASQVCHSDVYASTTFWIRSSRGTRIGGLRHLACYGTDCLDCSFWCSSCLYSFSIGSFPQGFIVLYRTLIIMIILLLLFSLFLPLLLSSILH